MNKAEKLIKDIKQQMFYKEQIKGTITIEPKETVYGDDIYFTPGIKKYLTAEGIKKLYCHQSEAIEKSRNNENVILVTPTASGKTLGFNIPVLEHIEDNKESTALYIYPAKALSNDQLVILNDMKEKSGIDFEAGIYDGDTDSNLKPFLREHANIIITNPYELHHVLPYHPKWKRFYKNLKYIVIDEAHRYKGVFGSNIAFLIRRLKRILNTYDVSPKFIVSTASVANPVEFIEKLIGEEFSLVDKSGAPSGKKHLAIWDSSTYPEKSVHTQTKDILNFSIKEDFQALCFTQSRRITELIRVWSKREDVLSYRAGYTPQMRRDIEKKLKSGEVKGVVSTNALELGIDIGQLDCIIISGYPGTISSFWQQAGRAGRKMQESAIFYLPFEDALHRYLMNNPKVLTNMNFESAVISIDNPNITIGQILCAVSESPSRTKKIFDDIDTEEYVDQLLEKGILSETPRGIIYSSKQRPQEVVSLNSIGTKEIKIKVDGKVLEEIEVNRAFSSAHKGAIHLHNAEQYEITELNIEEGVAIAVRSDAEYFTQSERDEDVKIISEKEKVDFENFSLHFGEVSVTEIYKSYKKKQQGEVIGREKLNLPPLKFQTESVWVTLDDMIETKIKKAHYDFDGAIHAAEHGLIALAPLIAMCDTNDLGGMSYPMYENGRAMIFIYDGYEGGIGISKKLFETFRRLNEETIKLIEACDCESGCPSCVYSPKCGNNNKPIDKTGGVMMLKELY